MKILMNANKFQNTIFKCIKKIIFFFFSFFSFTCFIHATDNFVNDYTIKNPKNNETISHEKINALGVSVLKKDYKNNLSVFVKCGENGVKKIIDFEKEDGKSENELIFSELIFFENFCKDDLYYNISNNLNQISFHFINSEKKKNNIVASLNGPLTSKIEKHDYDGINIITRSQWGADENLKWTKNNKEASTETRQKILDFGKKYADELKIEKSIKKINDKNLVWPLYYAETIKKIIVHHTAENMSIDKNADEVIRAIYYYHSRSRGWGDIGYNFLIDTNGNIYEGRFGGPKVVGGHVVNHNVGSIGISFLGNFENAPPTAAMIRSFVKFSRKLGEKYNFDPIAKTKWLDSNTFNISGHKEYSITRCPGHFLYKDLQLVRRILSGDKGKINTVFMSPGEKIEYKFNFKNNTNAELTRENTKIKILNKEGFVFFDKDGKEISEISIFEKILPNGIAKFQVFIMAKYEQKNSLIRFEPVMNNKNGNIFSLNLEVPEPFYNFEKLKIENIESPFYVGDIKSKKVEIRNLGNTVWRNNGNDEVFFVSDDLGVQYKMEENIVFSGKKASFVFDFEAKKTGRFLQCFKLKTKNREIKGNPICFEYFVEDRKSAKMKDTEKLEIFLDALVNPNKENLKNPNSFFFSFFERKGPTNKVFTLNSVDKVVPEYLQKKQENVIDKKIPNIRIELGFEGEYAELEIEDKNSSFVFENENIKEYINKKNIIIKNENGKIHFIDGEKSIDIGKIFRVKTKNPEDAIKIKNFKHPYSWDKNDNLFFSTIEFRIDENNGNLIAINELSIEKYLYGLCELKNDTPIEKMKAIAVVARSYAIFYTFDENRKFPNKKYDGSSNPDEFQKYCGLGYYRRSKKFAKAVDDTIGEVIFYDGKIVKTPFFNKSDGRTRSAEEVWGWENTPYLKSVKDKFCDSKILNGHGVGLSGCGSYEMAKRGWKYQDILKYFYTGIDIKEYY